MKWETPARSGRSSREPAPIQKPSATERTLETFSEITRSPESSSEMTYFCTGRSYPGLGRSPAGLHGEVDADARTLSAIERLVGEPEQRLGVAGVLGAVGDTEARAQPREPLVAHLREERRHKSAEKDGRVAVVTDIPITVCPSCGMVWYAEDIAVALDAMLSAMLEQDTMAVRSFLTNASTAA